MRLFSFAMTVMFMLAPLCAYADGQELYDTLCANCHGADGRGDGPGMPEEMIRPRPFSVQAFKFDTDADWQRGTNADIANVIKHGTKIYGGSPLMPPWPSLSDAEVESLATHVLNFGKATQ